MNALVYVDLFMKSYALKIYDPFSLIGNFFFSKKLVKSNHIFAFLDYLAVNGGETDQAMMNARHFYIGQWYRDANVIGKTTKAKGEYLIQNNGTLCTIFTILLTR